MSLPAAEHSYYPPCSRMAGFVFGLGSPLPASPLYIPGEQHRPYLYTQAEQHRLYIYISAEQHREYIFQLNDTARMFVYAPWEWRPLLVATPGSGGPSPRFPF